MLEKGCVTNWQGALLLPVTLVLGTAVLFAPAVTSATAGRDGWISLLVVATLYAMVVSLVSVALARRFPKQTLVEYAPLILGNFLGKVLALLYLLWFLHISAVIVREFGDFMLSAFMPETPVLAFNISLILLTALGVKYGFEVICRANEFIFPILILSVIFIFILVLPEANFTNLLPVMENGIKPVLWGGMTTAAFRGEVVLVLMFFPFIKGKEKTAWYLVGAVLFLGVLLALTAVIDTAVMGEVSKYLSFPIFSLARYIAVGEFIERVEALILVMWVAGVTIKVTIFYYVTVLGTAQFFGLRDYKAVILPIGVVMAVWSHSIFENSRELVNWLSISFPPYAFSFQLLLPMLLLTVALLRKKRGVQSE
ncbi:GerAB/ArcD/ProY family transporter [Desulfofalx alkaliphila]|uniref:GerAB/ArcD/ProY family transporter n=1 Tax=Desulfofalx alkaliphila TaxID=105483 RepID=UPI0004E109D1|nr:endospore germination permease [Desulfofalx alkaliphila]